MTFFRAPRWRRRALALPLLVLTACLKSEPAPRLPPTTNALGNFHARYGVASQFFTNDPQRISTYYTARGNRISVGYKAFLTAGLNEPVEGPVQLELREVLSKSEMVLSGTSTMAGEEILETGGQYFFKGTRDNRSLQLSTRVKLGFATYSPPQLAGRYIDGMRLYCIPNGQPPGPFRWAQATDPASDVEVARQPVLTDPDVFLCLIATSLYDNGSGWFSYAQPFALAARPTPVEVAVNAPAGDTEVYLVFRDFNAVAQLAATAAGTFALPNVPTGTDVTVVVIRATPDARTFYFGLERGRVGANQRFAPALTPLSDAAVAAEISRL